MKKKSIFLIVLFLMLLGTVPVMAASNSGEERLSCVNPLYADENIQLPKETVEESSPSDENVGATATSPYYASVTKAGAYIKPKMIARSRSWNFRVFSTNSDWAEVLMDVVEKASTATNDTAANAGDYIRWNFYMFESAFYDVEDIRSKVSGGYCYNLKGTATYMTTASQEAWVNTRVNSLMSSLKITSMKTEYEIVRTVYEYITKNVTYDYATLSDNSYLGKYSAYNALRYGTAICQGYANLMYRMLRQAGLSCRFIGGYSSGEGHAWNIVRVQGKYYNLDSTWDAGASPSNYEFFLKGSGSGQFPDHTRDPEYRTASFNSSYPMSTTAYTATSSSVVSYKITYYLNSGTNSSKNPSSYFQKGVVLQNPTRKGYLFAGWYTDSGMNNGITKINKTAARNYKLYAKWIKVIVGTSKIASFKSDGVGLRVYYNPVSKADGYRIAYSKSSTLASGTVKYSYVAADKTAKLIKVSDAERRYYVVVQAYRLDSAGNRVYGGKSGKVSGYTVQYVLNGGVNAALNPHFQLLRTIKLENPTRKGYQFAGWYTDSAFKKPITVINRTDKHKVVLYARWQKIS